MVNLTQNTASRSLFVSGDISGGGAAPILNISANYSNPFSAISVGSSGTESNHSGVINHTAGTVSIGGGSGTRRLHIAASATSTTSGNSGTYNFGGDQATAPTLDVTEAVIMGTRSGENGLFSLSGYGTVTVGGIQMSQFNGTSEWRIAGGNLDIEVGSGLSMGLSGGGAATIRAILDDSGFSTINLAGNVQFGSATGGGNPSRFVLELGEDYQHVHGREFLILDAAGDFTGHGVFGRVNGDTSYTPGDLFIVGEYEFFAEYRTPVGGGSQFVLTSYIPEPSSGLLVILGGLALLRRGTRG